MNIVKQVALRSSFFTDEFGGTLKIVEAILVSTIMEVHKIGRGINMVVQ